MPNPFCFCKNPIELPSAVKLLSTLIVEPSDAVSASLFKSLHVETLAKAGICDNIAHIVIPNIKLNLFFMSFFRFKLL